jgi:transcription elongation GreA/GreB family factor
MDTIQLTQFEYDSIFVIYKMLQNRQHYLRQSHIDAVDEGDPRECDAWSLTNDLSQLNYTKLKEINDLLVNAKIITKRNAKSKLIGFDSLVHLKINNQKKLYRVCHSDALEYIENGLSSKSPVGLVIFGKKEGYSTTHISNDLNLSISVLEVNNKT